MAIARETNTDTGTHNKLITVNTRITNTLTKYTIRYYYNRIYYIHTVEPLYCGHKGAQNIIMEVE